MLLRDDEPRLEIERDLEHGPAGELWSIVLLADVREHEVTQPRVRQTIDKVCGLDIAQMAEGAAHPRLERGRIGPVAEHLRVVIALDQKGIALAQHIAHVRGHTARVREHSKPAASALKDELARLSGIVGQGVGPDPQIADTYRGLLSG